MSDKDGPCHLMPWAKLLLALFLTLSLAVTTAYVANPEISQNIVSLAKKEGRNIGEWASRRANRLERKARYSGRKEFRVIDKETNIVRTCTAGECAEIAAGTGKVKSIAQIEQEAAAAKTDIAKFVPNLRQPDAVNDAQIARQQANSKLQTALELIATARNTQDLQTARDKLQAYEYVIPVQEFESAQNKLTAKQTELALAEPAAPEPEAEIDPAALRAKDAREAQAAAVTATNDEQKNKALEELKQLAQEKVIPPDKYIQDVTQACGSQCVLDSQDKLKYVGLKTSLVQTGDLGVNRTGSGRLPGTTRACGGLGSPACETGKSQKTGCNTGLAPDSGGACRIDPGFGGAYALAKVIESESAANQGTIEPEIVRALIAANPQATGQLNQFGQNLCGESGGICVYSDIDRKFKAVFETDPRFKQAYISLLADSPSLTLNQETKNLIAANIVSQSYDNIRLNLSSLAPSTLGRNQDLAKSGCNRSGSTYSQNGSFWACYDADLKIIRRLPDDPRYLTDPRLATSLFADLADAAKPTDLWGNSDYTDKQALKCSKGLVLVDRNTCLDPVVAAFDSRYSRGLTASALIDSETINKIPGLDWAVDHLIAPIAAAVPGSSYYKAAKTQAETAKAMLANRPEGVSVDEVLDTVSPNARAYTHILTADEFAGAEFGLYKTLAYTSLFTAAWTEDMAASIGQASGYTQDQAFLNYAETYSQTEGNYWQKVTNPRAADSAILFGGEIALTAADVVFTFIPGVGKAAETASARTAERSALWAGVRTVDQTIGAALALPLAAVTNAKYPAVAAVKKAAGLADNLTDNISSKWFKKGGEAAEETVEQTAENIGRFRVENVDEPLPLNYPAAPAALDDELKKVSYYVGAENNSQLKIAADQGAANQHARITHNNKMETIIEPVGNHPISINGQPITGPTRLNSNDKISLNGRQFQYQGFSNRPLLAPVSGTDVNIVRLTNTPPPAKITGQVEIDGKTLNIGKDANGKLVLADPDNQTTIWYLDSENNRWVQSSKVTVTPDETFYFDERIISDNAEDRLATTEFRIKTDRYNNHYLTTDGLEFTPVVETPANRITGWIKEQQRTRFISQNSASADFGGTGGVNLTAVWQRWKKPVIITGAIGGVTGIIVGVKNWVNNLPEAISTAIPTITPTGTPLSLFNLPTLTLAPPAQTPKIDYPATPTPPAAEWPTATTQLNQDLAVTASQKELVFLIDLLYSSPDGGIEAALKNSPYAYLLERQSKYGNLKSVLDQFKYYGINQFNLGQLVEFVLGSQAVGDQKPGQFTPHLSGMDLSGDVIAKLLATIPDKGQREKLLAAIRSVNPAASIYTARAAAGENYIYRLANSNQIVPGDFFLTNTKQMGTIVDIYDGPGGRTFVITKLDSQNQPQIMVVTAAELETFIGGSLKGTLFVRNNKMPGPAADAQVDAVNNYVYPAPEAPKSQPRTRTATPEAPGGNKDPARAAAEKMNGCRQDAAGYWNACPGERFYGNILSDDPDQIPDEMEKFYDPKIRFDDVNRVFWCTYLIERAAAAAGITIKNNPGAANMYKDFQNNQAVITDYTQAETGMVAFVNQPNSAGYRGVRHAGIVDTDGIHTAVNESGETIIVAVTILQSNAPTKTATYVLNDEGRLAFTAENGQTYYIEAFGDIYLYDQNN